MSLIACPSVVVAEQLHPWFHQDIAWVKDGASPLASAPPVNPLLTSSSFSSTTPSTAPAAQTPHPYEVTEADYQTAVSQVKFRWDLKSVGKRLGALFRRRSGSAPRLARAHENEPDGVGTSSEPATAMGRYARRPRSSGGELRSYGVHAGKKAGRPRTPTKKRQRDAGAASAPTRHQSQQFHRPLLHVPSPSRSKSVDRPNARNSPASAGTSATPPDVGPTPFGARAGYGGAGSGTHSSSSFLGTRDELSGSTRSFSPAGKSRFFVRGLWASGRSASSIFGFGGADSNASGRRLSAAQRQGSSGYASSAAVRSSEETSPTTSVGARPSASTGYATPSSPQDAFNVVPAVRAASWGNVADFHRGSRAHAEEVTSIYSGGGEDAIDDDVMLFGAGGVANAPAGPLPVPPMQPFAASLDDTGHPVSAGGHAMAVPLELLHSVTGRDPAALADPATQDAMSLARAQTRTHARSPLVQAYGSGDDDDDDSDGGDDSDTGGGDGAPDSGSYNDDSDDSFFERTSEDVNARRPTASEIFGSEDEDEDDVEDPRHVVEVRRRRPSFALRNEDESSSDSNDSDDSDSIDIR
jgi:hypothetical protein